MSTIVIALGGNALGNNVSEQKENAKIAASSILDLVADGHKVAIAHGNGPQVGMIKLAFENNRTDMPLAESTAMSQGYIGYHLQQALRTEMNRRGMNKPVATILTQVLVDKNDKAFKNPTKPIGLHYDEQTAKKFMEETGRIYKEDAGRGWRWVVASPLPVDICEKDTIKMLLENEQLVIACGGGGIPVIMEDGVLSGADAVIDKDFAAAKLGELISADLLFILTAVERVCINYRKPEEKELSEITLAEAEEYKAQGHFAPGSMLPKVEAGMMFVKSGSGRKAIIGLLDKASQALCGESGTVIR